MTDIEKLDLFIRKLDELRLCRLLQSGFRPSISIKWDCERGIQVFSSDIDEDDFKSFLLSFRPFIMESEKVYIPKICDICYRLIVSDELRNYLIKSRKVWYNNRRRFYGIKAKGDYIKPEYIADLWINGYYFHTDESKRQKLESIYMQPITKYIFYHYIVDTTLMLFFLGSIVTELRKEINIE